MIDPLVLRNDTTVQVAARYQTRVITRFQLERNRLGAILPWSDWGRPSAAERKVGTNAITSPAGSTTLPMPCEEIGGTVRSGGRRQSRWLRIADGFAVFEERSLVCEF
jgi:hypothetical protein